MSGASRVGRLVGEDQDAALGDSIDHVCVAGLAFVLFAIGGLAVLADGFDEAERAEPVHGVVLVDGELITVEPTVVFVGNPNLTKKQKLAGR